jgi:hypothetical protein
MKFLTKLKNLTPNFWYKQPKVLLGRWTIDYCDKKINKKIDLSNEDHCGTCNNKIVNNKKIDVKKIIFFEAL